MAIGDRILAVNGISLIGVTHKQAVETIKMAPQRTRLVLDRSIPVNIPKSSIRKARPQPSDKPFAVELVKGVGGLGLSLVGGKGAGEEHGGMSNAVVTGIVSRNANTLITLQKWSGYSASQTQMFL